MFSGKQLLLIWIWKIWISFKSITSRTTDLKWLKLSISYFWIYKSYDQGLKRPAFMYSLWVFLRTSEFSLEILHSRNSVSSHQTKTDDIVWICNFMDILYDNKIKTFIPLTFFHRKLIANEQIKKLMIIRFTLYY